MVYTAPDIKDRVAIGDNQFIMSDAGGGKILLTPAPDEVVEAGTDINKALLQPLCDAVEKIDTETVPAVNKLLPYNLYYWLAQDISGNYSEVRDLAWNHTDSYVRIRESIYKRTVYLMYLFYDNYSESIHTCTIKYASNININQSNGTITLANPTTTTFEYSQDYNMIEKTLAGKYITGIRPNTTKIFYIPATSNLTEFNSGEDGYICYNWFVDDSESLDYGSGTKVMYVSSKYNSTNSSWYVKYSENPDEFPSSGTVAGTTYIKLGRIDEAFLNYAVKNPTAFQNIATFEARLSALESAISGI